MKTTFSRTIVLTVLLVAVTGSTLAMQSEKLDRLVLTGPPGPLSIPLIYLVANDRLANVAEVVELVLWEDQNQLRALIAGGQADFVTLPSNNAAIFYNSGLDVQLLDIVAWNAAFGISADPDIASLSDAEGMRVVVPFQGSIPDLLFQQSAAARGLNLISDFALQYTPNPQQAAQLILSGQVDLAILPEPLATTVLLRTKDTETPLRRAFSLADEWVAGDAEAVRTPITGTVALAGVQGQPDVIATFTREYMLAVEWVLENPEAAGELAETSLPELGFVAAAVAVALEYMHWEYVPAADARTDVERFFGALMELSPDVVGGRLPDDDFYYDPTVTHSAQRQEAHDAACS